MRSQWWYLISSYISWAWSEASTGGGNLERPQFPDTGWKIGTGGAWSPLLVTRAMRCSQNPLEIPSWPLRFLGNASQKKKSAFFFPWEGRLPPGSSVAPVPHAHFHVVTTARNRELYIVLKSWTGIQNPKHVRNWGFFRCVMLFRIWLLIFNSANILVCLKWSCQLLWSNIRIWV